MRSYNISQINPSSTLGVPSSIVLDSSHGNVTPSFHGKEWVDASGTRYPFYTYDNDTGTSAPPPPDDTVVLVATTFEIQGNQNGKYNGRFTVYTTPLGGASASIYSGGKTTINILDSIATDGAGAELTTGIVTNISTYYLTVFGESKLVVIEQGDKNNRPIEFTGRYSTGWGEVMFQNMINQTQSYAGPTAPTNPFQGQLWFDTAGNTMNVWNGVWQTLVDADTARLTGQYSSGRITEIDNAAGALWVDETMDWDINYWLTRAEIADTRNAAGPTIDLTTKINNVIDALWTKYTTEPSHSTTTAGRVAKLRFHGSYLMSYIKIYPGMLFEGDGYTETIFVQAPTSTTDFLTVLAREGKSTKARASWGMLRRITLQGANVFGPDVGAGPVPLNAIVTESASADTHGGSSYRYNAYIAESVRAYGFSGHGFTCNTTRKRPRFLECRASGNGGDGFHIANCADLFMFECGAGSNNGHSVYISQADTPRILGGDFWASNNASYASGAYCALYIDRVQEGIIQGADINGVFEFTGEATPGLPYYQTNYKYKVRDCNFKFRASSFGDSADGGDGVPDPADGYVYVKNARGVSFKGNSYQPARDAFGNTAYRPNYLYYTVGDVVLYIDDDLPAIEDNLWPCGAVITSNSYDFLTNSFANLAGQWTVPDYTTGEHRTVFTNIGFIPGHEGGILGSLNGAAAPAGVVGEVIVSKINSAGALSTPNSTNTQLVSLTLPPGSFEIHGFIVMVAATATGTKLELCADTAPGTMVKSDPRTYAVSGYPFTSTSGELVRLAVGPFQSNSTVAVTYYLNVRPTFSAGSMSAYGEIRAIRRY